MFLANKLNKGAGTPTPPATTDPQFNCVTMLLHGDGTNGAQNNTFLDSSTNNFTITRNGNTTQGYFSPYGPNWSTFFDGANDNLYTSSTAALNVGSGNFTFECFFNVSVFNGANILRGANQYSACALLLSGTGVIYYISSTGSHWDIASGQTAISSGLSAGVWYHLALVRNGNVVTPYVNGVAGTTTTTSASFSANNGFNIGAEQNGSAAGSFHGYISNVRVVVGTAVYTSNFTPPTANLTAISGTQLLACQNNRFIDNSSNNFSFTTAGTPSVQRFNPFGTATAYSTSVIGGSAYIDNNGYLGCGSQSAYALGTGDFTINAWIYPTSLVNYVVILDTRGGGGSAGFALAMDGAKTIYFYSAVSFSVVVTSAVGAVPLNAWTYATVTRTSGTNRLYLNGVLVNTASNSDNYSHTALTCGYSAAGGGERYYGYMSDVQVIKGTAVAPTLPTAPVATSSGTSVLLNMQNAGIFDNAMMNNLETVGNAQISTSVVKYGTGSLAFDGTGDWLRSPDNLGIAFGSGNFTVEGWIYLNNVSATKGIIFGNGNNSFGFRVGQGFGGNVNGLNIARSGVLDLEYCAFTFATGTWYHIAVVRSGTTIYFFVNGTQQTTQGSGGSSYNFATPTSGFYFGANNDGNENFNGNIDDFRITKGYARYTANFTPPTAAFFDTGPV